MFFSKFFYEFEGYMCSEIISRCCTTVMISVLNK